MPAETGTGANAPGLLAFRLPSALVPFAAVQ